ncbi:hypothetical protein HDU80_005233 [Chytriomyces hyalinus]|nr:hypothetical protein HDU80_005233 [Chytriomyces hyalinus]
MSLCTLSLAVQPFSASVVNGNLVLAASVTSNPPDALLFSLNALGQIVTRDNKCLSISSSSVKAGACDTANSWVFEGPLVKPAGKPTICLDNFGRRYVVGNQVGVWTCNKGENQNWTLSCTAPSITGFSLPAVIMHQNHNYNDNKYYYKVNYKHYQHFNGLAFSLDNFNNIKDDFHFNYINDNGHYNNIKDDLHFNNVNNNSYINNINDNDHFKDDLHFNNVNDNGHFNYFKNNNNLNDNNNINDDIYINDNNNINDNIYINDVKDINYVNYINDINYITDNIHNHQNHSHNNNQNNNYNDNQHIHNQHNCDQHKHIICHACSNNSKCWLYESWRGHQLQ